MLKIEKITDSFIKTLDTFRNGIDWGYATDPVAFVRWGYDRTRQRIYAISEYYGVQISNKKLATAIKKMIQKNDFADVLLEHIKGIQDKIPSKLGYLAEKEGLVLYPLPGGEVVDEDMAGTQTVSLPFEIAIKSRDQELNNNTLWQINAALSKMDLELPSKNGSYEFLGLKVDKPYLNDLDEQGLYIYLLDVTASLEIERNE